MFTKSRDESLNVRPERFVEILFTVLIQHVRQLVPERERDVRHLHARTDITLGRFPAKSPLAGYSLHLFNPLTPYCILLFLSLYYLLIYSATKLPVCLQ